jgi:hypothetical protein
MKVTRFTLFRRVMGFWLSTALLLIVLIVGATNTAAQTPVFVPGNASGCFGNTDTGCPVPLVSALAVSGPGTITVTYVSGMVNWGGGDVGPNGGPYLNSSGFQFPLQEAKGIASNRRIGNIAALIGVFVPQSRVQRAGFNALDGTKNVTKVGIMPGYIFFIGTGKTFSVSQAGTLFLGINDTIVTDNSGGFNVTVSVQ